MNKLAWDNCLKHVTIFSVVLNKTDIPDIETPDFHCIMLAFDKATRDFEIKNQNLLA